MQNWRVPMSRVCFSGSRVFTISPGGTPLYNSCRYVQPLRVGFLRWFGLKRGVDFAHFGLESCMVYEGTTVVCQCVRRFNSK